MPKSPTSRTIEYLKNWNYETCMVERYVSFGKFGVRKDAFGFIDLLAIKPHEIVAVQSCGQAFAAHHRKMTEDEEVSRLLALWLDCGGRVLLIGWRRVLKKRGGKARIWKPRIREYFYELSFSSKEYGIVWEDE